MKLFRLLMLIPLVTWIPVVSGFSVQGQFGAGIYPAAAHCPYPYEVADGASEESDKISDLSKDVKALEKKRKDREKIFKDVSKEKRKAESTLRRFLRTDGLDQLITHMDQGRDQTSGVEDCTVASGSAGEPPATTAVEKIEYPVGTGFQNCTEVYVNNCFCYVCGPEKKVINVLPRIVGNGGEVDDGVCGRGSPALVEPLTRDKEEDCKRALREYQKLSERERDNAEKISAIKDELYEKKSELADAKYEKANRDDDDEETEAGGCSGPNCTKNRGRSKGPSTAQSLVNLAGIGLGAAASIYGFRKAVDVNSQLGWPTDPRYALGLGYGLMSAGAYYGGVGSGVGGGAFACAGGPWNAGGNIYGGVQNGGAFGYPPGMIGGPGGIPPWMMGGQQGGVMGGYPGFGGVPGFGGAIGGQLGGNIPPWMMGAGGGVMGGYPGFGGVPGFGGNIGGTIGGAYPGMMPGTFPGAMGGGQYQMQMLEYQQRMAQEMMMKQQSDMALQMEIMRLESQRYQIYYGGGAGASFNVSGAPSVLPFPGPGGSSSPPGTTIRGR